jgi:hypothetical protein
VTTSEPAARAGSLHVSLFLSFVVTVFPRYRKSEIVASITPLRRTLAPGSPRTRQPRRPATAPAQRYELYDSRASAKSCNAMARSSLTCHGAQPKVARSTIYPLSPPRGRASQDVATSFDPARGTSAGVKCCIATCSRRH